MSPPDPSDAPQGSAPTRRSHLPLWLVALGITSTLSLCAALIDGTLMVRQAHTDLATHGLQAARLGERILALDEVLTSSARLAAATGEPQWQQRHARTADELDATLRAAITLAPDARDAVGARQAREANESLLAIESRVFAHVRAGELEAARDQLDGEAYREAKQAYAWGMARFAGSLRRRAEDGVLEAEARIEDCVTMTMVGLSALSVLWIWMCGLCLGQLRRIRHQDAVVRRLRDDMHEAGQARDRCLQETSRALCGHIERIRGATAALGGDELSEAEAERLGVVNAAIHDARVLLDDMSDLARLDDRPAALDQAAVEPLARARAASEAWALTAAEKGLRVRTFAGPGCPSLVRTDGRRLEQLLERVIGHAVASTEEGGVAVHVGGRIGVDGLCRLRFTIRDSSAGLEPDELARRFAPFEPPEEGGAAHSPPDAGGLGLAIAMRLVTHMGGTLVAESEPGEGTTVWIDFFLECLDPRHPDEALEDVGGAQGQPSAASAEGDPTVGTAATIGA